jgi:AcrR family transcriptional regulator
MTSKQRVAARRAYHHGDLPTAMITAAGELLREHGVEGVSLRTAAAHAGVSSAAPYRHFEDKDSLLVALAISGYDALIEQVKSAPKSRGTFAAIQALVVSYARFALQNPQLYRLMMGAGITDRSRYDELTKAHNDMCNVLIEAVDEAQRRKNVAGSDPVGVAMTLWCMVHGLATLAADGRINPKAVETEVLKSIRIVGAGLRPRK